VLLKLPFFDTWREFSTQDCQVGKVGEVFSAFFHGGGNFACNFTGRFAGVQLQRVILNRVLRGEESGYHLNTLSIREDITGQILQSLRLPQNDLIIPFNFQRTCLLLASSIIEIFEPLSEGIFVPLRKKGGGGKGEN
jgi:hypothetical protein